jgi:hypothetical protein
MSLLTLLCEVLAVGLIGVGVAGLVSPQMLSRGYGVHARESISHAWVRATAVRDLVIGIALGIAAYAHVTLLMVVLLVCGVALSIADFTIAYHAGEKRAHLPHAAGAVAFLLVLAMALFAIGK